MTLLWPATADAQVPEADRWIEDVAGVGTTFHTEIMLEEDDGVNIFVADEIPLSDPDDEDRIRLIATRAGSGRSVTFSSATCIDPVLRSRFGDDATCLVVPIRSDAVWDIIARPVTAPSDGQLAANIFRIRPADGEVRETPAESVLGALVPIQARRVSLGGARFRPRERELFTVEIPGGLTRALPWVEERKTGGPFVPFEQRLQVVALRGDGERRFRSGLMGWIAEEDWVDPGFDGRQTLWVSRAIPFGRKLPSGPFERSRAPVRIVRNDDDDGDGDGLGHALETVAKTCDRPSDMLRFFEQRLVTPGPPSGGKFPPGGGVGGGGAPFGLPGPFPIPVLSTRFDCRELVRPEFGEDDPLRLARLRDTDQDGHTDYNELLGRDRPDGALSRWGTLPYRKVMLIEADFRDPDAFRQKGKWVDPTTGCDTGDTKSTSLWKLQTEFTDPDTGVEVDRLQRDVLVDLYAAERTQPCDGDPTERCPIPEWTSPDGTSGVALHFDLGPPPPGVAFDPLDTTFMDLGGGGDCIPLTFGRFGTRLGSGRARSLFMNEPRRPYTLYMLTTDQGSGGTPGNERSTGCDGTDRGTCAHEIGHVLNLNHWGSDHIGAKHNHKFPFFSRMNYRYQNHDSDLLFSTGELEARPLETVGIQECAPFGEDVDLGYLEESSRRDFANRVCKLGSPPACVSSSTLRTDVDWDGDGEIGHRVGGEHFCDPADTRKALQNVFETERARWSTIDTGHAAAVFDEAEPQRVFQGADAVMPGVTAALHDQDLLVGFIDTRERVNVALGEAPDTRTCDEFATQCAPPSADLRLGTDPTLPRSVLIDADTRQPVKALNVALLELREERQVLAVLQPPDALPQWGFVTAEPAGADEPEHWLFDSRGSVAGGTIIDRPALARDPGSGEIVMLWRSRPLFADGELIVQQSVLSSPSAGSWETTTPAVDEGSGPIAWEVEGGVGLAAWQGPADSAPRLYAGYARPSDHRIQVVGRTGPAAWTLAPCSPFRDSLSASRNNAVGPVTLGVSRTRRGERQEERLWAVWGRFPGQLYDKAASRNGNRRLRGTARVRSVDSSTGLCDRSGTSNAVHDFAVLQGPPTLVWDDRHAQRLKDEGREDDLPEFDGLRVVSNLFYRKCNKCLEDGPELLAPSEVEGEQLEFSSRDCATPFCHDNIDGFPQSSLLWQPFFDPLSVRERIQDFNDYPFAEWGLCTHVLEGEQTEAESLGTAPPPRERCMSAPPMPLGLTGTADNVDEELFGMIPADEEE